MTRRNLSARTPHQAFRVRPKKFVFFDKGTGTERFGVSATLDGSLPVDQAASLMAIHCLVRGGSPGDFGIMVAPEEDLLRALLPVAARLVEACAESRSPVNLSHRQGEVLRALMRNHSNKEIAGELHLSVRTVKFHVSALLEKFNVHSRVSLIRKTADIFGAEALPQPTPIPRRTLTLLRSDGVPAPTTGDVPALPLRMAAGQRASR
ncbi:MAG TPA: LuxR C-terminal-related transcriptional regulator [Candidatus Acidoferrales bacterium]|nr:LuxR C-terminal-related transcriptional regulator [Candidatus Acidoferrales bacterium]